MKGHIRQRSKGSWEICLDIGRDPATGKRRQHFETVKGHKAEAQRRLAELLLTIEQGSYIKPKRMTLAMWLEEWLKSYVSTNCSVKTSESYQSEVRCHLVPALGAIPLVELRPQHLQNYYARTLSRGRTDKKGGLSRQTVLYHHRILFQALRYAVKQGLLSRNVAEAVDPPRPERKKMATLAAADIPKFLEAAHETPYYCFFFTLLYTGLRRGEALALKWCSVDIDMASISVVQTLHRISRAGYIIKKPKSPRSRRSVALSPSLALLLRQHKAKQQVERLLLGKSLADDDFVFAHPDGTPLDPDTVTHAFSKIVRSVGLPYLRLHDLRHTHATLMLKAGIHPKVVSERLGHASVAITLDTYSHVLPGLQEAAAKRFDMLLDPVLGGTGNVGKMLAKCPE
jgi:integrase